MNEAIIMIIWLGASPNAVNEPEPVYKQNLIEQQKEQPKQEELPSSLNNDYLQR